MLYFSTLTHMVLVIGYYTLPISCLIEPHSDRLLRTAKDCRVEELKKAMRANPSIDTAPIVGLVVLNEGMVD